MDCPEADRLSLAFAPPPGEAVDPPSLPSVFAEYPPDLMDSHATDQCHDNTPAIAENSFATPIGIVKSRPRNEIWVASSLTRTTISRTSNPRGSDARSCPCLRNPQPACVWRRPDRTVQLFRARDSPLCRSQFVQSLVHGLGNRSVCSRRSLLRPQFMASVLAPVPGWTPPCRPSR